MSLDELRVDEHVFSFAVISDDQQIADEKIAGHTAYVFAGELSNEKHSPMTVRFAIRLSFGRVAEIFEEMRDRVMLRFPASRRTFQSMGKTVVAPFSTFATNLRSPLHKLRGK
jgi:hypothetical protein